MAINMATKRSIFKKNKTYKTRNVMENADNFITVDIL
jgi:hypothetical protein